MKDDTISRAAALKGLEDLNIASFYEENEHSKEAYMEVKAMLKALPPAQLAQDLPNGCTDTISRAAALSALNGLTKIFLNNLPPTIYKSDAVDAIKALPSAQPNLSEAYSKAVFTWLMDYQIRAAELNGRYTPYEVLSWVINDWRKENG